MGESEKAAWITARMAEIQAAVNEAWSSAPTPPESDWDRALEEAAETLDDFALTLVTTSDQNPDGNTLTAAIVTKCAVIVRQHKTSLDSGGEVDGA